MDLIFKVIIISIVVGLLVSVFCWTFDVFDYFFNPDTNTERTITMRVDRTIKNMRRGLPIAQFTDYIDIYDTMTFYDLGVDILGIFGIDINSVIDIFDTIEDGMRDFFDKFSKILTLDKVV